MYCVCVHLYVPLQSVNNVSYFMLPPNIKAPKVFFSFSTLFSRVKGHKGSPVSLRASLEAAYFRELNSNR